MNIQEGEINSSKLNLRVLIDPKAGFCTGVKKAIQQAEEILEKDGELFCIGQIVHNDEEIKRLEKKGLRTIDYTDLATLSDKKVLFRAHGEPPSSYLHISKTRNTIIDATCPIVLNIQDRIKLSSNQKETILIYGKKEHPEVIGLKGQVENDVIVFNDDDFTSDFISKLPGQVTLFSQTTMDTKKYADISSIMVNSGINVNLNKTICGQVSGRKKKLEGFCKNFDKIIFVAGEKSSNGKVLFEYCYAIQPNSHYISSVEELDPAWFSQYQSVGVTGGTSTPQWLMEKIATTLESF